MEIQVYTPTKAQPLPPVEWNYTEVKQWMEDRLARYKGVVYDDTQIALAKTDRANLNKLAAAIDTKRKEMKALYLQPYTEFEAQAKELTAMVKMQVDEIDAQIKAFDNFRKEEKLELIKSEAYAPIIGDLAELIPYERLHNPKWLNVTTSMAAIGEEIAQACEKIISGLKAIDQLNLDPDITERVKSVFLRDFDLAAAIAEKERIMAEREKLERYQAAQTGAQTPEYRRPTPPPPPKPADQPAADEELLTVAFRIRVTRAQLEGLGAYMKTNNIKPERV